MTYIIQEYLLGWYEIQNFKSFKEAKSYLEKEARLRIKRNKRAEKNSCSDKSFGKENDYPRRIKNIKEGTVYPFNYSKEEK